jgi:hypothetical protein
MTGKNARGYGMRVEKVDFSTGITLTDKILDASRMREALIDDFMWFLGS